MRERERSIRRAERTVIGAARWVRDTKPGNRAYAQAINDLARALDDLDAAETETAAGQREGKS